MVGARDKYLAEWCAQWLAECGHASEDEGRAAFGRVLLRVSEDGDDDTVREAFGRCADCGCCVVGRAWECDDAPHETCDVAVGGKTARLVCVTCAELLTEAGQ